ncbi:MAG: dTMP kinase [Nitrospinae bacterium]|nr:dTMP kinase [Nitrospinota bacterium]
MCVWNEGRKGGGVFIVIEGLDGAGKSTQADMLVERLKKSSFDAVKLKEPTNGRWGTEIRRIAEEGREHLSPDEEAELFIKDREEDSRLNIIPALSAGKIVVMDRYINSNAAYQGALGLEPEMIFKKNAGFPQPDAVFFLELTPEEGLRRVNQRGAANAGFEKIDYLKKVHDIFNGDAGGFKKMIRIDALKPPEKIAEIVWQNVAPLLKK